MKDPPAQPTTRLAPSPTGALHLGNARTFLINWAMARAASWRIVLRIEDLAGPRIKPGAAEDAIDVLRWLGLDWDGDPLTQSHDLEPYRKAMRTLVARRMAYPSDLGRGQVDDALSGPQEGSHEIVFPASLRPSVLPVRFDEVESDSPKWRFVCPEGTVQFVDGFMGSMVVEPARSIGDFIIWTRTGQPAYQLAVVVDDHRQSVMQVVRGNDLLDSTARQLLLYRGLGYTPEPSYTHLPLVRGPDGRRLAKRHGDTRLSFYREHGVPPERIIGLLAAWTGILDRERPRPMSPQDFVGGLKLSNIPPHDVVFTPEDHRWLLTGRKA